MWKTAFAGAIMLAMAGSSVAQAEVIRTSQGQMVRTQEQGPALSHAQIATLHATLRLRPDQEQYWPAVSRVLHGMVKQASSSRTGLVQRLSARAYDLASDAVGLKRLAAAARPLVHSLDDQQKFAALQFVNAMGYGAVVAQF
jgi:hypothetical protein